MHAIRFLQRQFGVLPRVEIGMSVNPWLLFSVAYSDSKRSSSVLCSQAKDFRTGERGESLS